MVLGKLDGEYAEEPSSATALQFVKLAISAGTTIIPGSHETD